LLPSSPEWPLRDIRFLSYLERQRPLMTDANESFVQLLSILVVPLHPLYGLFARPSIAEAR
jgi:hypothetical protein